MTAESDEKARQVVLDLERELKKGRARTIRRNAIVFASIVVIAGAFAIYRKKTAPPPPPRFTTSALERRDILLEVQATGVVEPVNQVEVGSQVSGRVVKVHVDFNDPVKQGQLLAEVDPDLFGAEVVQARGQLTAARAAKSRALATVSSLTKKKQRADQLRAENLATPAELEQLEADLEIAHAEVSSADAQISQLSARVSSAETTLGYTKIYSPIDGVIIDRKIEAGQTVAASFNTPVLFLIAQDLERMRVIAEIDESDVGQVKESMDAKVVVDAFPDDTFEGVLKQVRLSPKSVEGVVTYSAVIDVKNKDGKLRPGLTATATLVPKKVEGALAVRNTALRFEPLAPKLEGAASEPQEAKKSQGGALAPGERRVFVPTGSIPSEQDAVRRVIRVGISDGVWTEVLSGLTEGEKVITDERVKEQPRGPRLF